ncbi:MAG: hypothetical protein AB7G37_03320 [Solirubrobacteraceae bacterium]
MGERPCDVCGQPAEVLVVETATGPIRGFLCEQHAEDCAAMLEDEVVYEADAYNWRKAQQ